MNETQESNNVKTTPQGAPGKNHPAMKTALILFAILLLVFVSIAVERNNIQKIFAKSLLAHAEKWPIVFYNSFDGNQLRPPARWKPTDGATSENFRKMLPTNGHLEISVAPTQNQVIRDAFFNEYARAYENFLLTVEIATPFACHTGLVFRGNPQGEYYVFLVGSDTYTVEFLARNSDGDLPREAIIQNKSIPKNIDSPHKLSVLSNYGKYFFYINNIFVDEMSDSRLNGERTGIEILVCQNVMSESVFELDDFTLRTP